MHFGPKSFVGYLGGPLGGHVAVYWFMLGSLGIHVGAFYGPSGMPDSGLNRS